MRLLSGGILTKADADIQSTQLEAGVKVGVFAAPTGTEEFLENAVNNSHTVAVTDDAVELTAFSPILFPASEGIDVFAYAPHVEDATSEPFTFTVSSDQSIKAGYLASDLLHSAKGNQRAGDGDITLEFDHKMAKVNIFLYEGSPAITLKGATVTLNGVATSVTFDPMEGSAATTADIGNITAATFPTDAQTYQCAALFPAHTHPEGTFVTIKTLNNETYEAKLSEAKTFAAGSVYTYAINVKPIKTELVAANITSWEEGHTALNVGAGDIQSITFLSEYVEECAIAYYDFKDSDDPDALKDYKEGQDLEFNYLIRPADMAVELAKEENRDALSMTAYYARTKSSLDDFIPMTVKDVFATEEGLLTVIVNNPARAEVLSQDFYNGLTSAKAALSVQLGATDFTTKFVQIVPKDNDPNVYAEKVVLSLPNATVSTGENLQLTATVYPENVTTKGVTWYSSATEYATVDQNGTVTANKENPGSTVITAVANMKDVNGLDIFATCEVEVTFVQPEVYIVGAASTLEVGATASLKYAALPSIYTPQHLEWSSSDESLITIDQQGVATGVAYENTADQNAEPVYKKATITLVADGKYTATFDIAVIPVQPKSIVFTDEYAAQGQTIEMKVGQSATFTAKVTPDDAHDKGMNWWIQAPGEEYESNKASGETYNFTATKAGQYVIHPKHASSNYYNSVHALRYINVTHVYYSSLEFKETSMTIKSGVPVTPEVVTTVSGSLPASWTDYTLTSSDPETVSVNGKEITGEAGGDAVITVTYYDAAGEPLFTDTMTVTVVATIDRVGWYYYSDGTYSADLDGSKTVIGIIFSNYDATQDDPILATTHPKCTNGLVVAINDIQTTGFGPEVLVGSTSKTLAKGYGNTELLKADTNTWGILDALATMEAPGGVTSGWYIPSWKEWEEIVANYRVNDIINGVGGTLLNKYDHNVWLSTPKSTGKHYYAYGNTLFDSGQWNSSTYYGRFIFAF